MTKQPGKAAGDEKVQSESMDKGMNTGKGTMRGGMKTVPLSTRISQEDAEFLSSLKIDDANTPSEKLRVIIAEARKREEGMHDYRSSLLMYQNMLNQLVTVSREIEMENQIHSELVSRLTEWLPDMMAFATAMGSDLHQSRSVEDLKKFEEGITDRSFRLFQSILQMGISETCPCYQSDAVSKRMAEILYLVNVIQK